MSPKAEKKAARGLTLEKKPTTKQWPSKRTMNLAKRETTMSSPIRALPLFAVAMVLICVFAKFGVIDRLGAVSAAENSLEQNQQNLARIQNQYADLNEVTQAHLRYSYGAYTEAELALTDRLSVLDLLERTLMPAAQVKNLAIANNSLSLTLAGITLEQTSTLVADLQTSPIVESVAVYTAGFGTENTEGETRLITMTVTLVPTATEGGEG